MPEGHRLTSKADFQDFCASLKASLPTSSEILQALKSLSRAELSVRDRNRFASHIGRYAQIAFDSDVFSSLADEDWRPEIGAALSGLSASRPTRASEPRSSMLSDGLQNFEIPPIILFLGTEDEHRASMQTLRDQGFICERVSVTSAIESSLRRDLVVGIVVGASWWQSENEKLPLMRLESILGLSNLCWMKIVRSSSWETAQGRLYESCMKVYFSHPPGSRLAIEDQATVTGAEIGCIRRVVEDFAFCEGQVEYDFLLEKERLQMLRASLSRYLGETSTELRVRTSKCQIKQIKRDGETLIVAVELAPDPHTVVIKISSYLSAHDEARRFRCFSHGTSLSMQFYCHGDLGALVFAPTTLHFGELRSLRDVLGQLWCNHEGVSIWDIPHERVISSFRNLAQQGISSDISQYCAMPCFSSRLCANLLVVDGGEVPLREIWDYAQNALSECPRGIQHGDAHPGNILINESGIPFVIDFECAGLAPICFDLSVLWTRVVASHFVPVSDERGTMEFFVDLLTDAATFSEKWCTRLAFSVNHQVTDLARKALEASVSLVEQRGGSRRLVLGVIASLLCEELETNPQQFIVRCILGAISRIIPREDL